MIRPLLYIFSLSFAFLFWGCGKLGLYNAKSNQIIVSVGENNLYESDLSTLFAKNMSDSDSIFVRNKYIEDWTKTQVLQTIAQNKISEKSKKQISDIKEKVDLYRKKLILYEFETSFIESKLDTIINLDSISRYYYKHIPSFILSSPLIKGAVARIPAGVRQSRKLENLFLSKNEEDVSEFLEICGKNNYLCLNYVDNWVDISEIAKIVPISINKADEILSKKKFYDVEDDNWRYMLRVDEYLPSGSPIPLERVKNNIKKILLHDRKLQIKNYLEDSLMRIAENEELIKKK